MAELLLAIFRGKPGPQRDIVLVNAAAAIVLGEKAPDLRKGIQLARESLDSGAALAKLEGLRDFCARAEERGEAS
jgi:anthranilate phosphoribosyltransferase